MSCQRIQNSWKPFFEYKNAVLNTDLEKESINREGMGSDLRDHRLSSLGKPHEANR